MKALQHSPSRWRGSTYLWASEDSVQGPSGNVTLMQHMQFFSPSVIVAVKFSGIPLLVWGAFHIRTYGGLPFNPCAVKHHWISYDLVLWGSAPSNSLAAHHRESKTNWTIRSLRRTIFNFGSWRSVSLRAFVCCPLLLRILRRQLPNLLLTVIWSIQLDVNC